MSFIKKYQRFVEEFTANAPVTKPGTKDPVTKPAPSRPSPVRRDKPSREPDPKAELPTATADEVANRFLDLMDEKGEDVKKYIK